jgi:hypothetical protein
MTYGAWMFILQLQGVLCGSKADVLLADSATLGRVSAFYNHDAKQVGSSAVAWSIKPF